jgi:mRNA-degrading endonuclease RelE of RelBE toxin-antitoxin system
MKWKNGSMAGRKNEIPIVWDINEKERFKELIKDIKKRSEPLARQIKDKVRENLEHVKQNPEIFETDPFKENNDGSFRKFTAIYVRIIYKIDPDKIIVTRVRHAASEPTEY